MATVAMQYGTELRDTPVGAFLSAFNETNRRGVYNRVAQALWTLVRRHFREIEPSHHKTAESFNPAAKPTGYWERAIRSTTKKFDAKSATVTINQPGISRAFAPLDIHRKAKMLTIPARPSPEAYGKRAREVAVTERLFFAQTKSGVKMLATSDDLAASISRAMRRRPSSVERPKRPGIARPKRGGESHIRPVFWLKDQVHIKRDESILPSNKEITDLATNEVSIGVRDFVLGRK